MSVRKVQLCLGSRKVKGISLDRGDSNSQTQERQIDCEGVAKGYSFGHSSVEIVYFAGVDEYCLMHLQG
jgi:hypothetical protein